MSGLNFLAEKNVGKSPRERINIFQSVWDLGSRPRRIITSTFLCHLGLDWTGKNLGKGSSVGARKLPQCSTHLGSSERENTQRVY